MCLLSGLEARSPHNCLVRVPAGLSQAVPAQFCVPVALRVEWACPTRCLLCGSVVRSVPRECSLMDPIPEAHVSALSPTPRAQPGGFGQVSLPVRIPVSAFVKCQSIESCFAGLPPQLFLSADQKKMTAESFAHRKTLGSVREGSVTWNRQLIPVTSARGWGPQQVMRSSRGPGGHETLFPVRAENSFFNSHSLLVNKR